MSYRVVIAGLGSRAKGHLEGIRKTDGLEAVAGVDPDGARRGQWQDAYGFECSDNLEAMIEKYKPDVVSICTGEKPRYEVACAAMEAGIEYLVLEKPMAASLSQARDLMARADRLGVKVAVSHQMRFADEFVAAKQAIERGDIGRPYYMRASSYGQLMEQGPHMIDMLLYLLGGEAKGENPAQWVMGQVADREEGLKTVHQAPAFTTGYICFRGDVRAAIECGRTFAPAVEYQKGESIWLQKRVQVVGTEGMVDAVVSHWCRLFNRDGEKTLAEGPEGWNGATIAFYGDLLEVLKTGREHRCNGHVSLAGFEIIHAIYESAVRGDKVTLPLEIEEEPLSVLMAPVLGKE
ncbi:MAG: Gfo/Idh/MocA family protein [Limnochordia bacterium]